VAKQRAASGASAPGPLVEADWLAQHLDDPDLRVVHVSTDRRTFNKRHIPGATYCDLHREIALRGRAPETGDSEREGLLADPAQTGAALRRWRVGDGDRLVLYDDIGLNRHAARVYWHLRLYRFPTDRLHMLDGGIDAWATDDRPTTTEVPDADLADALRVPVALGERDDSIMATYDDVADASHEATTGSHPPSRLLDVRRSAEWVGSDLRSRRGGHIPGARLRAFEDLVGEDGRLRTVDQALSLIRASGADPGEIRAVYCQSGTRAALAWFLLHELAGLRHIRNYAGSWEEWGNRSGSPVEMP
jgi:thiosulfate/3-mercaptopyruvate sulfurtransferase